MTFFCAKFIVEVKDRGALLDVHFTSSRRNRESCLISSTACLITVMLTGGYGRSCGRGGKLLDDG